MTKRSPEKHDCGNSWKTATAVLFIFLAVGSISIALNACLPAGAPLPVPSITLAPTNTPTPTVTIVWFPPTATPTLFPTPIVTSTEVQIPEVGKVLLTDDFSNGDRWSLSATDAGSAALGKNELTIAISKPDTYIFSIRDEPIWSDFYVEINASPTLCRDLDEYGLLFRWGSRGDFYRYSLSCNGQVRLDRLIGGTAAAPQPWMVTGVIPPGAPKTTRLAVWVKGDEMQFYLDDIHQFSLHDPMISSGFLGVFARSAGDNAVTVNFADLVVREVVSYE